MNGLFVQYSEAMAKKPAAPAEVPPEISAYMSAIASKKTPARAAASRANAAKASEARRKNPLDVPCTCGGGDSLNPDDHKTTCPRGLLLKRRARAEAKRNEKEEGPTDATGSPDKDG